MTDGKKDSPCPLCGQGDWRPSNPVVNGFVTGCLCSPYMRVLAERDEARENLARGKFNAAWLVVGWCGLVEVYKHLAEGFEGIESYVKLVRAMEKPIVTAEWVATVTEANRG